MEEKKPMPGLFRDQPETSEGKYLIKRRDGSVVEWPSFVLGARDPIAAHALNAYAQESYRILLHDPKLATKLGLTKEFVSALFREVAAWDAYRENHGTSDPGMGRHRVDDPATIEEMRKGRSA